MDFHIIQKRVFSSNGLFKLFFDRWDTYPVVFYIIRKSPLEENIINHVILNGNEGMIKF